MINRIVNSDVTETDETINNISKEFKPNNVEICFRDKYGIDELIDVIEGNRVYIPALYAINKIYKITIEELDLLDQISKCFLISAQLKWNLDELLKRMGNYLWKAKKYIRKSKNSKKIKKKEIIGKRYKISF